MKLTNPEKLILTMLAQIHEKLEINEELRNAIFKEYYWALSSDGTLAIDNEEIKPPEVNEVIDILDMWTFIETACESFNDEERREIKDVKFGGFDSDANNEGKFLSIAKFLIDDMGKFSRFKGRELKSPTSVETYRRMLTVFLSIRPSLVDGVRLNPDQVIEILKAKNLN